MGELPDSTENCGCVMSNLTATPDTELTHTIKYLIVPNRKALDGRLSPPTFYTIIIDRKGLNLSVPSVSISTPEKVERFVSYSIQDRITGTFEQQVMEELIRLGYEAQGDSIMVFQLPKNDRGVDFVTYNDVYIEIVDEL